jgi:phosphatidate phosphatase APP1
MTQAPPGDAWKSRVRRHLQTLIVDADDHLDAAQRRFNARFGRGSARHIAAYRGYGDARGVELIGRVLEEEPLGGPQDDDAWWDNLLNIYRRFESDEVPGVALNVSYGGSQVDVVSDAEGYYTASFEPSASPGDGLWANALVSLADGTLATPQPVMQVLPEAKIGIISDIDDTVLHSGITDWKVAAQLTFLHNARTRKPLQGVAKLYQALQAGPTGAALNPIFYVSSSPWNLYDLLEDFMELNAIPLGPIFLRDLGFDTDKFLKTPGHGHKLERAKSLIERFPQLRWVLLGDSGQADAELYAHAAQEFGHRIAAIYIRDVDPDSESLLDRGVDAHIQEVAGTSVPMLRARDSLAIAEHAAGLGLLAAESLPGIAAEVIRDQQRPTMAAAVAEEVAEKVTDGVTGKS